MKNKKGFTLVELMAVIVVLAIIIAIALPAYNRIKLNIDQKNYENKIDLIKVAAAKYSEDTKYETMYVDDLIRDGYLDADDEQGYIYDPRDAKKIMNCYLVQSVEEAGIYYSKVIEKEYGTPGQCEANIPNSMNTGLKIKMYKIDEMNKSIVEEIKYNQYSKWWVNTDVQLKAEVNLKEGQSVKTYEWYRGYDQTPISTSGSEITVPSTSVLQQNYTLRVTLNDGKIMTTIVRVYIDKIEPKFYDNDATTLNSKWVNELNYNIKSYDNESGLYGYKLYKPTEINENIICPTTREDYVRNKKQNIENNGTYIVCIMDNAGNTNQKSVPIDKIDKNPPTKPTFEITSCGETLNSKTFDLKNISSTDSESGIEHYEIKYGSDINKLGNSKIINGTSITIMDSNLTLGKNWYFKVIAYDKAGNSNESDVISKKCNIYREYLTTIYSSYNTTNTSYNWHYTYYFTRYQNVDIYVKDDSSRKFRAISDHGACKGASTVPNIKYTSTILKSASYVINSNYYQDISNRTSTYLLYCSQAVPITTNVNGFRTSYITNVNAKSLAFSGGKPSFTWRSVSSTTFIDTTISGKLIGFSMDTKTNSYKTNKSSSSNYIPTRFTTVVTRTYSSTVTDTNTSMNGRTYITTKTIMN